MVERTVAFDESIVADDRKIYIRAVVDISDPDKIWLPVTASPHAPWSKPEELHDKVFDDPPRLATLEPGRWLLGGGFRLFPQDYAILEHVGYVGSALSGADGTFATPQWVSVNFSGMRILQACSVFFSTDPLDGIPVDFKVEVIQGGTAYFSQEVTGNTETHMGFDKFTVQNPDCVKLTVTRWSLPGRRIRIVEIVPGIYEDWDANMLETFRVTQQGQFSCLTLPYGTAEIGMDNQSRRFDPRNKDGIFQSIEERQGVEMFIGVRLPSGLKEYKEIGMFYQAANGWKTSDNSMIMHWSMVDLIGLIADRTFLPPKTLEELPTTLEGWLRALVSQMGENFERRYRVDPEYANLPVTANSVEDVTGKKCGDILRWACQVTGTWPRANSGNGAITAEPLWNQGDKLTLDNMTTYPRMSANESLAALIFRLADGNDTEIVIPGNSTSSEKTVTIINPFLHTVDQARAAARLILAQYGGNIIETTGRGNPASEIGDVDTIWLDASNATTARRMMQTFEIRDRALQGCQSKLLQADGSYLWTEFAVIRESGQWQAPPGVHQLRIVLGQGGQGGGYGRPGTVGGSGNIAGAGVTSAYGDPGEDGQGGAVWYGVIDINEGQIFEVVLGNGGAAAPSGQSVGSPGEHTSFGPYTSENGKIYENGYTDIANGQSFARTGVETPLPGTGDGGKGGEGGDPGEGYWEQDYWPDGRPKGWDFVVTKQPGPGHPGVKGATGFVMVTWEKPEEASE